MEVLKAKYPCLYPIFERHGQSLGVPPSEAANLAYVDLSVKLDAAALAGKGDEKVKNAVLYAQQMASVEQLPASEREEMKAIDRELISNHTEFAGVSKKSYDQIAALLASKFELDEPQTRQLRHALPFASRTQVLLAKGGDDRLILDDESRVNKYYAGTVPDDEILLRSSCTASTLGQGAFTAADEAREKLLHTAMDAKADTMAAFDDKMEAIRDRIKALIAAQSSKATCEVLLTPSGSDAEFAPTAVALARARRNGGKVINIITAAGEVGSGTAGAAGFEHFSKIVARAEAGGGECNEIHAGQKLQGIEDEEVTYVEMKPRDHTGAFKVHAREKEVVQLTEKLLKEDEKDVVVLHVLAGSKTGLCYPSMKSVKNLVAKYPTQGADSRLLIVVDACQLRSHLSKLAEYLELNCCVLITGSKFFGGAPFSGGVLMPENLGRELDENSVIPEGLGDYFTAYDMPRSMKTLRARLPTDWINMGLCLRWESALAVMERYMAIPDADRAEVIDAWCTEVADSVTNHWPFLTVLPEVGMAKAAEERVGGLKSTIVAIIIRVTAAKGDECPTKALSQDELKKVHKWLQLDMSETLPAEATAEEKETAKFRCLIGQPVKLGGAPFGVVRIALGAQMVVDWFDGGVSRDEALDRATESLETDHGICAKMALIAKYWHEFTSAARL